MRTARPLDNRERVLLVGVGLKKSPRARAADPAVTSRDSLQELEELATSAGADISGSLLQVREALDPATLVGRGKLDEIRAEAHARNVPLVIVDHDLTPVQLRNMEKGIGCRVIDRTQLILDIFACHARTREGQLQVELAQLNYLLPRLTGRGEAASAREDLASRSSRPTAAASASASPRSSAPSKPSAVSAPRAAALAKPCPSE
jgi:GTP-binding protein HflX